MLPVCREDFGLLNIVGCKKCDNNNTEIRCNFCIFISCYIYMNMHRIAMKKLFKWKYLKSSENKS